jgi:rubrerythrin
MPKKGETMVSYAPLFLEGVSRDDDDREILRAAIIREFDIMTFYEQMAQMTENDFLRGALLEIARAEKHHIQEFKTLLGKYNDHREREVAEVTKEVTDRVGDTEVSPDDESHCSNHRRHV